MKPGAVLFAAIFRPLTASVPVPTITLPLMENVEVMLVPTMVGVVTGVALKPPMVPPEPTVSEVVPVAEVELPLPGAACRR